jgi:hypothetical protein
VQPPTGARYRCANGPSRAARPTRLSSSPWSLARLDAYSAALAGELCCVRGLGNNSNPRRDEHVVACQASELKSEFDFGKKLKSCGNQELKQHATTYSTTRGTAKAAGYFNEYSVLSSKRGNPLSSRSVQRDAHENETLAENLRQRFSAKEPQQAAGVLYRQ